MSKQTTPGISREPVRIETAEAAEALCNRLMESTADLLSLLDRETALLQRGRPHEIVALQAHKKALSAALVQDMESLRNDAPFVRMAAPGRVDAIREQHASLQKALTENQDALSAMKAISEQLLRTIASKASRPHAGPEIYGRNAGLTTGPAVRTTAISVDTAL